jgi:hypothetical protein
MLMNVFYRTSSAGHGLSTSLVTSSSCLISHTQEADGFTRKDGYSGVNGYKRGVAVTQRVIIQYIDGYADNVLRGRQQLRVTNSERTSCNSGLIS